MSTFSRSRSAKATIAALLFALAAANGWSQTATPPARLVTYPVADTLIFVGSAGMVGASYLLEADKPKPDLSGLSTADIPPFDRWYTTHRSEPLSLASDATLVGTVLLPGLIVTHLSRDELVPSGVVYAEALALSYGLKSVIKGLVVRYRPYAYAPSPSPAVLANPELQDSFPSGHVTVAFAAAVAGSYIYSLYDTSPGARAGMWGATLGLASLTAVLRVWSGNHFLSDVVAAAGIGSLVGVLLPYLHSPSSLAATGIGPAAHIAGRGETVPILQWQVSLP